MGKIDGTDPLNSGECGRAAQGRRLVVIDPRVEHAEILAEGLTRQDEAATTLLRLDPSRNGVAQIAAALAQEAAWASLHVVSHGAPGAVELGGAALAADTLARHAGDLGRWGDALGGGDIVLYGCRAAAGAQGDALLTGLAAATGCAITASEHEVGAGVGWRLDVARGGAPAPSAFSAEAMAAYPARLADVTVTMSLSTNEVFLDEGTPVTWTFTVDGDIPDGGVPIWFFADQPGASFVTPDPAFPDLVDNDLLPQAINQFDLFALFFSPPTNIEFQTVDYPDPDVSTLTGLRDTPDFSVFQLPITGPVGTLTLPTFPLLNSVFNVEGETTALTAPYSMVWKITDAPLLVNAENPFSEGGILDTLDVDVVFEGSPQITVYESRSDLPDNVDPTAVGESYSVAPGQTLTVNAAGGVLANDSDGDSDPITAFILENPRNGSLTLNDDGSFDYTPDDGFTGTDEFTYLVRDDAFGSSVATATIDVEAPGLPVVSMTSPTVTLIEDQAGRLELNFSVENLPEDGVIVSVAFYRPEDSGEDTLKFGIADFALFPIFQPGLPPLFPTLDGVQLVGGWQNNDGITFRIIQENASVVLPIAPDDPDRAPGDVGATRNNDVGVESLALRLVDFANLNPGLPGPDPYVPGDGASEVIVKLKDTEDQTYEAGDDRVETNGRAILIDVMANDAGGVEIVSVEDRETSSSGLLQNGTVTIDDRGTADTSDDLVLYTPDAEFVGEDVFAYLVRHADGRVDQARVTVNVTPFTNADPAAADDAADAAFETSVEIDVLGNDGDDDGDDLTIVSVGDAANGTVVIDDRGTDDTTDDVIVYTPDDGFEGEDTFIYEVSDGNGGTDTASVTVAVAPPPAVPEVSISSDIAVLIEDEGTTATFTINLSVAPPPEGLLIPIRLLNINLGTGLEDDRPLGDFDVFPPEPFAEFDGVQLVRAWTANDGLTVRVLRDGATITLPIFDDPDREPGDPGFNVNDDVGVEETTFEVLTEDDQGTAFGGFTISPTNGSVTVQLRDTANQAPDAGDDEAETAFETSVEIDVLANDSDPEGDDLRITEVGAASNGFADIDDKGTADTTDDVIVYTPDDGFEGEDTFTYQVVDEEGETSTATVTVSVGARPNVDPVAVDDDFGVNQFGGFIDVLENDDDPDGGTLRVTAVNGDPSAVSPNGGPEVPIALPSGALIVVLESGFVGFSGEGVFDGLREGEQVVETFDYTVSDGQGGSAVATVTITVTGQNDAPTPQVDMASTPFDTAVEVDVLANDSDPEGDDLSIASVGQGENGSVAIDDRGTDDTSDDVVVYTPDDGFVGEDTFTYEVSDGNGGTAAGSVTVTVAPPTVGGEGRDVLVGTDLDDVIDGGAGTLDRLTGGGGEDDFVFRLSEASNGRRERDLITDFVAGEDELMLLEGVTIERFALTSSGANVVLSGGDGDLVIIRGEGIGSVEDLFMSEDALLS